VSEAASAAQSRLATLPVPLQGMTGFARASVAFGSGELAWELKSLNSKGLEVRLRLPSGYDRLEPPVRQAVARHVTRGTVHATLTLQRGRARGAQPAVNEVLLRDLAELAQRLHVQFGAAPARADGLLALRGVLDMPDADEPFSTEIGEQALALLDEALSGLAAARQAEGMAINAVLSGHLDAIEALVARVARDPSREPDTVRARLAAQVMLLVDAHAGLDQNRLAAEAALLAAKADVQEEVDRLAMHAQAVRTLLAEGGAIGRRLDFIGQELNREANTLCAKSNAAGVTAAGLELKAVIDQLREQLQNLE